MDVSGNGKGPSGVGDVCPESFMNPKSPIDLEWPWSSEAAKLIECGSFQGELVSDEGSQMRRALWNTWRLSATI